MTVLHLLFRVGESEYALPAEEVLHVDAFEGATRVPGAPEYVAGLVHVRRKIVAVIDLRLRFGLPAQESTKSSRVIVVGDGSRSVGLLVDSAREVQKLEPDQLRAPPELLVSEASGFVRGVIQLKDRLVMLLDTPRVIGQEAIHVGQ